MRAPARVGTALACAFVTALTAGGPGARTARAHDLRAIICHTAHVYPPALPNRDGWVDYAALVRVRPQLDSAIVRIAREDTTWSGWRPKNRAGLHVDLYNLVMMRAVLDRWKPGWTPAADGFAVFKAPLVPTREGPISLDELEKKRTPAVLKDPRLHVAFNCAARSCPPLLGDDFTSLGVAQWDTRLDQLMTSFVRDTTRNRVDHARRVLRLSRIFDWYAADFGGRAGVLRTVSSYLGRDVSGYRVEFLEYDWSLNAATFPDGSKPR